MVIEDAFLSETLKQLRHDLTQCVSSIDPLQRIVARDSIGDVGRTIRTDSEYVRGDSGSHEADLVQASKAPSGGLIQANLARAQQALRTIEEFSKPIDTELAAEIEQLRYRTYTVEKAVLTTVISLKNLSRSRLYVLIEAGSTCETENQDWLARVKQLIDAKVGLIQLREKEMTDRQLIDAGRALAELTRGTETRFIMNDRADLALACNADGVHLGQDDVRVSDARRILGAAKIIGVSTHSIEQAKQAVLDGANYIGVGPVFPSQTKQFDSHVGLDLVSSVATEIQLPAFAIGGIHRDNLDAVLAAGLNRIAVSAAVMNSRSPGEMATQLNQMLAQTT